MNEARIYMTDGNEYSIDYEYMEQTYTTVTFVDGNEKNIFSKFNMICMVINEQDNCDIQ